MRHVTRSDVCAAFVVFSVAVAAHSDSARAADHDAADVRAAWDKRSDKIKSFEYICELETTYYLDPRGGPQPPRFEKPVKIKSTFSFARSGEKLAYRDQEDNWNEATGIRRPTTWQAVFNGTESRLLASDDSQAATVIPGRPATILTASRPLQPIWLASEPVALLKKLGGWTGEEMTVARTAVSHDGVPCVEIMMPYGEWRHVVLVDPVRDYVPLKFITVIDGRTREERSIEYIADAKIGWRVAKWTQPSYDENGRVISSARGTVTKCTINHAVPDEEFELEFPEGTRTTTRQ